MTHRKPVGAILGSLAIAGAGLIFYPSVPAAYGAGLTLAAVLGSVILLTRRRTSNANFSWIAIPFGVSVLVASHFIAKTISADEKREVLIGSASSANTAGRLLEQRLDSDARALARLANRMRMGYETNPVFWEDDAWNYYHDGNEYQAIEWIDANLQVKRVVPLRGNESALHLNLSFESRRKSAVNHARYSGSLTVSRTIHLVQGGRGFLIYAPVVRDHRFEGMVAGVVNVQRFVQTLPSQWLKNHALRIWDDQTAIFSNVPTSEFRRDLSAASSLLPSDSRWVLETAPMPSKLGQYLTPIPRLVSGFGAALAVLVCVIVLLWERSAILAAKEREGRLELAALSEAARGFTYVLNIQNWTLTHCNRFTLEFLGVTSEEVLESGIEVWRARCHPEDLPMIAEHWQRLIELEDGEVSEVVHRLMHSDGSWHWVLLKDCILSRLGDGQPREILGAGQDITALRIAEEQARQSKVTLEEMVDLAPIGMALFDLDGNWIRVNAALCNLVEYSLEELQGSVAQTLVHPDDLGFVMSKMELMISGEIHTFSIEERLLAKGGAVLWVMATFTAVRGASGEPTQFISQVLDISERKQMELNLLEHQRLLESASSELTKELSQLELEIRMDALTGVYNRRSFDERLEASIRMGREYGHDFSLILLDIDHFKEFNDEFGHDVGDRVLRTVGEVLRESTRNCDIAARYGGEEFAVICPGTRWQQAFDVAERVRKGLEMIADLPRPITASFGVSVFKPGVTTSASIIKMADQRLYQAKQEGRNRVCMGPDPLELPTKAECDTQIAS